MKRILAPLYVAAALIAVGVFTLGAFAQDGKTAEKTPAKPQLGVYIQNLSAETAKKFGVEGTDGALVTSVMPKSAAEEAGLRSGDVVISVDGRAIKSAEDLTDAIAAKKPGDVVKIVIKRKGTEQTISATLTERSAMRIVIPRGEFLKGNMPKMWFSPESFRYSMGGHGSLGIRYEGLNPDLGAYFGVADGKGVLVLEVMKDSAAEKAGVKSGDVIVSLDDREITDGEDLQYALSRMLKAEKESTAMIVLRNRQRMTLTVKPEKIDHEMNFGPFMRQMQLEHGRNSGLWSLRGLDHLVDLSHLEKSLDDLEIEIPEIDPIILDLPDFAIHEFLPLELESIWPHGLDVDLEINDDGSVTFNGRDFESIDAFRQYLKSEQFKQQNSGPGEKTKAPERKAKPAVDARAV